MDKFVLFISELEDISEIIDGLKSHGIQFQVSQDVGEIEAILRKRKPSLIVLKDKLRKLKSEELLTKIITVDESCFFVVFSDQADVEQAKKFIDLGAWDFWIAPLHLEKILILLKDVAHDTSHIGTEDFQKRDGYLKIVGKHKKIKIALALAKKVALSNATILISGESGTGKELIARYIHINSPRASKPFIAVNCAAIPENLLESELFGYEKGAFTGAYKSKPGKFELAQGGTILLDEVSEMDLTLQAKLLRVIQEKEIDRLGGTASIKVDVRIIATTNRDLKKYVEEGKFRQDLYFRLNVIPIHLPPLRERGDDVILLANYFLNKFSKDYGINSPGFSEEAIKWLREYDWPGNIRELENLIERAMLIAQEGLIKPRHFLMESLEEDLLNIQEEEDIPAPEVEKQMDVELNRIIPLEEMEKQMIIKSLEKTKGNRTKAAELLGISVRTLRNKLNKLREEGISI